MSYKLLTMAGLMSSSLLLPHIALAQSNSTLPGAVSFQTQATPGQYRASKLVGVKIYNNNNETIGDVNDLIVDKNGSIVAVVIGVGGFLGIGEKNVALPYNAITWSDKAPEPMASAPTPAAGPTTPASNPAPGTAPATTPPATMTPPAASASNTVEDYPYSGMLAMTKDQLKAAPEFKYASEAASK